jgi:sulfite reductase (NADPH) flavoprotein alpha-component
MGLLTLDGMTVSSIAAPPSLPLEAERLALLGRLTEGLDPTALAWVSGYVAGLAADRSAVMIRPAAVAENRPEALVRATVLYGSQTGNGRRIAEQLARTLESQGSAVRLLSTLDYPTRELAQERLLYLVVSTHGDGDPPDDARAFAALVLGKRAPRFEKLAFSVLALGDSSYPKYCETGRLLDERLAALGARRLVPRIDSDVDFERPASIWLQKAAESARTELGAPRLAVVTQLRAAPVELAATREHPLETEVLGHRGITARQSERSVVHLELAAPAGILAYEPGDAVGIWPENPPETVARILDLVRLDGAVPVAHDGRQMPLGAWLAHEREITRLTKSFLQAHAARAGGEVAALLAPEQREALRRTLRDWQVADALKAYPADWSAIALVEALRPLTPRLYSIASSRREVGDELHLTVASVDYRHEGERRFGAASRFLSTRTGEAKRVRAYVEPNPRFRLPADADRDVIMVGAGTGVAPFRGFVQERAAVGAKGRNWLVFGGRHLDSDFLYQAEWLEARKRGALQRLDVAFSRDQERRVYVQERLGEQGAELYRWLEGGAYFYVCGDAERMAPDVNAALIGVVAEHGARSREAAEEYVAELVSARRYLRDVY